MSTNIRLSLLLVFSFCALFRGARAQTASSTQPVGYSQTASYTQPAGCGAFRKGVFHVYQSSTGNHYILYRNGSTEKEVIDGKEDSTIWNIQWQGDCDYTLEYVSGNIPLTDKEEKFLRKHKLAYHLQPAGADNCVYTETIDKPTGTLIEKDTIRLHEVAISLHPAPVALQLRSEAALRQLHFSDTSHYAVVYIYRPKKLKLSLSPYNMYINDNLVCVMKNNSGFMFAVFREGDITLKSQLAKDTCSLTLTIQFGKRYYVRSTNEWGIHWTGNSKLAMAAVPAAQGKDEFEEVNQDADR